jgi:hypothetical protein
MPKNAKEKPITTLDRIKYGKVKGNLTGFPRLSRKKYLTEPETTPDTFYEVRGTVYDPELLLEFEFKNDFDSEETAKAFARIVANKYPISEIVCAINTSRDILYYL